MEKWFEPKGPFKRIYEVESCRNSVEPIEAYSKRYLRSVSELNKDELGDPIRYYDEVISEFEDNSSVLVVGSGHSYNVNTFLNKNNSLEIDALDFVMDASTGLDPRIGFCHYDLLRSDILFKYDYIFSSHTVEHFSRKELLYTVLPKLLCSVKKAIALVVPYKDNWGTEPTHKCRFYEDDELASLSDKIKIIRNGVELVYWINK